VILVPTLQEGYSNSSRGVFQLFKRGIPTLQEGYSNSSRGVLENCKN